MLEDNTIPIIEHYAHGVIYDLYVPNVQLHSTMDR